MYYFWYSKKHDDRQRKITEENWYSHSGYYRNYIVGKQFNWATENTEYPNSNFDDYELVHTGEYSDGHRYEHIFPSSEDYRLSSRGGSY